jgi:hypothetical protein
VAASARAKADDVHPPTVTGNLRPASQPAPASLPPANLPQP